MTTISGKQEISARMLEQLDTAVVDNSISSAKGVLFVLKGSTNNLMMEDMNQVNSRPSKRHSIIFHKNQRSALVLKI